MSVEMKRGRWQARDGAVHAIDQYDGFWIESSSGHWWNNKGWFYGKDDEDGDLWDLVRYLGPLELSPTPACAEAGPAGDPQTVSTEDPQESLRRMRVHWNALCREEAAYGEALLGVQKAKGNLEEAIKVMEREVEG